MGILDRISVGWFAIIMSFILFAGSWMFLTSPEQKAMTGNLILPQPVQASIIISILAIVFVSLVLLKFKDRIFKR